MSITDPPCAAASAAIGSAVALAIAIISGATPLVTAASVAANASGAIAATSVANAAASIPSATSASVVSVPASAIPNNAGLYIPTANSPNAPTPAQPPGITS